MLRLIFHLQQCSVNQQQDEYKLLVKQQVNLFLTIGGAKRETPQKPKQPNTIGQTKGSIYIFGVLL